MYPSRRTIACSGSILCALAGMVPAALPAAANDETGAYAGSYWDTGTAESDAVTPYAYDTNLHWQLVNGTYYLYNSKHELFTGFYQENGKLYYVSEYGMLTRQWIPAFGSWYYFDANGACQPGWKKIDGKWFFFNDSFLAVNSGWCQIDGKSYYFTSDGVMKTGWLQENGVWYYFGKSGAQLKGQWMRQGSTWYYFHADGSMATGWVQVQGKPYYMDQDGRMMTGTVLINGNICQFDASGVLTGASSGVHLPGSGQPAPAPSRPDTSVGSTSSSNAKVKAFLADPRFANGADYGSSQSTMLFDSIARGCVAYALDFAYYTTGRQINPTKGEFTSIDEIRAGDLLSFSSPMHTIVVLSRNGNQLTTAEGNLSGKVRVSDSAYSIQNGQIVGYTPMVFAYGIHTFQ